MMARMELLWPAEGGLAPPFVQPGQGAGLAAVIARAAIEEGPPAPQDHVNRPLSRKAAATVNRSDFRVWFEFG
jgi:hypothetical protein